MTMSLSLRDNSLKTMANSEDELEEVDLIPNPRLHGLRYAQIDATIEEQC